MLGPLCKKCGGPPDLDFGGSIYRCSSCGFHYHRRHLISRFLAWNCPNCGAEIDLSSENETMHWASFPLGIIFVLFFIAFLKTCFSNDTSGENASGCSYMTDSAYYVGVSLANVRECPSMRCTVIFQLSENEEVEILQCPENGWIKIRADSQEGYIARRLIY